MQNYLVEILESKYECVLACDGIKGIELCKQDLPDLIISDVMMPNLDGISFVKKLSNEIGVSSRTLSFKIKSLLNLTPNEYLRIYRLNKSAILLKENQGNITNIAYEVGFSTPQYFSRCFKAYFNLTPKEYIKQSETVAAY